MGISKESGSSLIEVMVSLFVMAIGLLGVLAMQTRSVQYNQSAYSYSQAVYLANDLAERIRANSANAEDYADGVPNTEPADCSQSLCNGEAMAQHDLWNWNANVQSRLPGGSVDINEFLVGATRKFLQVTVCFDDSRVAAEVTAELDCGPRETFNTAAELAASDDRFDAIQRYTLTVEI